MNWLDVLILLILVVMSLIGVIRGLVREVTSFLAIILAVVLAGWMYPQGIQMVRLVSARYQVPPIVGFVIAFVFLSLLLTFLGKLVRRFLVYPLHLRWLDRLGGLVFGSAKGLTLVMSLVLIVAGLGLRQSAHDSMILPFAAVGARLLAHLLPAPLRDQLMEKLDELDRIRGLHKIAVIPDVASRVFLGVSRTTAQEKPTERA